MSSKDDIDWLRNLAKALRNESAEKFSPLKLAAAENAEQIANDLEGIDTNGDEILPTK